MEKKKVKNLANYLKGTGKTLELLSAEILAKDKFDKEDEELLSEIGANLLFEAKVYTFKK